MTHVDPSLHWIHLLVHIKPITFKGLQNNIISRENANFLDKDGLRRCTHLNSMGNKGADDTECSLSQVYFSIPAMECYQHQVTSFATRITTLIKRLSSALQKISLTVRQTLNPSELKGERPSQSRLDTHLL